MPEINYAFLIEKLNIDKTRICDDLSQYYEQVSNRYMQRAKIERTWGNVEIYVDSLYWMKFVLKLSNYEMDELTGVKDFYKAYKDLGWNYNSFDFSECQDMHKKEMLRLAGIYAKYDSSMKIFQESDFLDKRDNISLKATSITRLVHNYKVNDIDDLVKQMYFLVYVEKLNTSEIALIFGKDRLTVGKLLRTFNMGLSRKEARERIEKHGRGNHMQSAVAGKQTMLKRSIKNGVTGNNSENICRASLETRLYSYLNVYEYEFIVGLSSNAIIPPKEIDIPIIIYKKASNRYYRYAIELDGAIWHKKNTKSDEEKNENIKNTDWKLIRIWFKAAEKSKKEIESAFRRMSDDVCTIIMADINNEAGDWKIKYLEGY